MQPVAVTQVDEGLIPDTLPPRIAGVVRLVRGVPEAALPGRHALAQALLSTASTSSVGITLFVTDGLGERVDGRRAEANLCNTSSALP